jgi:hypothetical protein
MKNHINALAAAALPVIAMTLPALAESSDEAKPQIAVEGRLSAGTETNLSKKAATEGGINFADIVIRAQRERIRANIMARLAYIGGGKDPLSQASVEFALDRDTYIEAGRILSPRINYDQPPAAKITELQYPSFGVSQPFFDQGASFVMQKPLFNLNLSLLSGQGNSTRKMNPDIAMSFSVDPARHLSIGVTSQISPFIDDRKHVNSAFMKFKGPVDLQAEVVEHSDDKSGQITYAGAFLTAFKPLPKLQVYSRGECKTLQHGDNNGCAVSTGFNIDLPVSAKLRSMITTPVSRKGDITAQFAIQSVF